MALPTTVATRAGEPGHNPPHLSGGNVYVILQGSTANIECFKATDPVSGSFTEQDGANRPTVPNLTKLASVQDGAKIHVAVYAPSSYSYARFDCSTDTWDTVGATGTDVIIESVSTKPPNQTWCSIAVDNTNVYIGYNGQTDQVMGGAKERADYAYRSKTATSGTFTTGVALDAAGDVHYANPVCVQSVNTPSDLIHFIWWRQTDTADPPVSWGDFQARSSDNNVLQTTVTEAISPTNGLLTGIHNAVCYTDGGRDLVVVCAGLLNGATRDLLTAVCDNNGTTDIITTVTDYYEALNVAVRGETGVVSLAVDTTDSNKLYALVGDATDADVGYATSTNNSDTWSAITDHVTAVSNEISANVYNRSGDKLAYVYDDNGTTKYHEVDIAGGTQTPKSLAYTGTGSLALAIQTQKSLGISGVGTLGTPVKDISTSKTYSGAGAAAITKQTGKVFTYTGTGTLAALQSILKFLSLNYTGLGTMSTTLKDVGKPLTFSGTGSSAITKETSKSFASSGTGTSAITKQTGKAFTYSGTGTLAALQSLFKTISLAISGTGSAALTKQVGKVLSYSGTGTSAFSRALTYVQSFAISGVGTSTLTKQINKVLAYAGTGTMVGLQTLVKFVNLAYTASGTAALVKQTQKAFSYAGTGTSAFSKVSSFFRAFAPSGTGTAGITKQTAKAFTYTGTGTMVAAIQRVFLKSLAYAATGTMSAIDTSVQYVRSFAISGVGTSALTKQINAFKTYVGTGTTAFANAYNTARSFSYTGTGSLFAEAELTLIEQLMTYTGVGTATLVKQVGKVFGYSGTGTQAQTVKDVATEKVISGTGTAVGDQAAQLNESRSFSAAGALASAQQFIAATGSAAASSIKAFFAGLGRWF